MLKEMSEMKRVLQQLTQKTQLKGKSFNLNESGVKVRNYALWIDFIEYLAKNEAKL